MGPERRVELMAQMCDDARDIALSGIRARHPDYDEKRARRALFRLLLGDAAMRDVWPDEPLVEP